jgi:predicted DsbA family dithiol-disulfide isomerase
MKPELRVTVFSDYICPFCYIGHLRLAKLRDSYDLKINWRFLEIHPDNPPEGRPLSELGYPPDQWRRMMENLQTMAMEEGVELAERTFTTNSRKALLLAEAAKDAGVQTFYRLNAGLFEAYFVQQQNIGDPRVLRTIAKQTGVEDKGVEQAWSDPRYAEKLQANLHDAARLGINGTPTFIIGQRIAAGAVPVSMLRNMADIADIQLRPA